MGRVVVTTHIAAPPSRVWRALTEPTEVAAWDELTIVDVPTGYPQPGQHATWRLRVGPLPLALHDRPSAVEPTSRLCATIDIAFVRLREEYRLADAEGDSSELVADHEVSSRVPGLGWLAVRMARSTVEASMRRLAAHCEKEPA